MGSSKDQGSVKRILLVNFIQLLGLGGFALGQPIFHLISRNPEFLVAHHAKSLDIELLTLLLILAPPLMLMVAELLANLAGRQFLIWIHLFFVFVLTGVIALPPLCNLQKLPWLAIFILAATIGVVFAALYLSRKVCRTFVTLLALGTLFFAANFLFTSPVNALIFVDKSSLSSVAVTPKNKPPIIMVVMDEFDPNALLDNKLNIDDARFPNLANLAKDCNWYRNATSVHYDTIYAVPAILSGCRPRRYALPILKYYPNNLFTLLAKDYNLKISEVVTHLNPGNRNGATKGASPCRPSQLKYILKDITLFYQHLMLPRQLKENLLPISQGWANFNNNSQGVIELNCAEESQDEVGYDFRQLKFQDFVHGIMPDEEPTIHYIHILLPHTPYSYLPSGQIYANSDKIVDGLREDKTWSNNESIVNLAHKRYLLQVGFMDKLIGDLVARLKATGMFDKSLLILVADHGVSFQPGQNYRYLPNEATPTAPDILSIPMFIKLPNQTSGQIIDRFASSIDILPTIAEVLGVNIPWKHDGLSLLSPQGRIPLITIDDVCSDRGGRVLKFDWKFEQRLPGLKKQNALFGERVPLNEVVMLVRHPEIIGRKVSEFPTSKDNKLLIVQAQASVWGRDIDLNGRFIPLYVNGRVVNHESKTTESIALATNGVIRLVTSIVRDENGVPRFYAVLPPAALVQGHNDLKVFLVQDRPDGSVRLVSPNIGERYTLKNEASGTSALVMVDGKKIAIKKGQFRGVLQRPVISGESLIFSGWGIDKVKKKPVDKVLVFSNGHFIEEFPTGVERKDLINFLGQDYVYAGYYGYVPRDLIAGTEISLYLVSGDAATECQYMNPVAQGGMEVNDLRYHVKDKTDNTSEALVVKMVAPLYQLGLDAQKQPVLIGPDKRHVPIQPGVLRGIMDKMIPNDHALVVRGWAINEKIKKAVDTIVIFANGRFVGEIKPGVERKDIAAWLGPQYLKSGFEQGYPTEVFNKKEISAYVISDGVASECKYVTTLPGGQTAESETRIHYPPGARWAATPAPRAVDQASSATQAVAHSQSGHVLITDSEGNSMLVATGGKMIPLRPEFLRGILQPLLVLDKEIVLRGWAINEHTKKPVDMVVFFSNGKFVGEITPNMERKDIADWLGPQYLKSGFEKGYAKEIFDKAEISVYIISDGVASECKYINLLPDGKPIENKSRFFYPPAARSLAN